MPLGRNARMRRLVRRELGDRAHALVIGPTAAVRQALRGAVLDVVGTSPYDPQVTVVSRALGAGSLPRRWDCVVVTEPEPPPERLEAATSACLPGGVVAVLTSRSAPAEAVSSARAGGRSTRLVHLVVTRVPG